MQDDFNQLIDSANANKNFQMPQIEPSDYPSLCCDKCGCVAFNTALIIKKIPGILVQSSKPVQLYPDQILICAKCGTILKKDREYYKLTDDGKDTVEDKGDENIETNLLI